MTFTTFRLQCELQANINNVCTGQLDYIPVKTEWHTQSFIEPMLILYEHEMVLEGETYRFPNSICTAYAPAA
jgi:hypothetical protein